MSEKRILLITGLILSSMLFIVSRYPMAAEPPDIISLNDHGSTYEPVEFDHSMHMDITSCADCHHHTTGDTNENEKCLTCHCESGPSADITCGSCHPQDPVAAFKMKEINKPELFHEENPGLKRVYHLKCLGCHRDMGAASGCEDCHPKKTARKTAGTKS